jgi:oxalate decarboxylase
VNYEAGDVGYLLKDIAHDVQNLGDEPLRFLEMFRNPRFMDVSLDPWMALTPPELIKPI